MPIPFIMPKMDMDQEEAFIGQWLKKEGDHVEKGETVIIIETDKITSEVRLQRLALWHGYFIMRMNQRQSLISLHISSKMEKQKPIYLNKKTRIWSKLVSKRKTLLLDRIIELSQPQLP